MGSTSAEMIPPGSIPIKELGTFRKCLLTVCMALEKCEYWQLSDQKGKLPVVVGWWPSCTVTFIENHDTGSTQVDPHDLPRIYPLESRGNVEDETG
ncbi:alpha-amylase type B isozyme-like isoform X2 [Elaeis guineensis]|uniref:alpha-amylase type B isozyme-like isoform X2 n=1 Tax=Elaeis guineensis var. tenera TaxID=51953 RepID=UPI003C6D8799